MRADAAQITELEAALALERTRSRTLAAQVRNLADHDPLTDLLNRRSLERELEDHLARCARYGPEGALLLVGLDGLDALADTRGQLEADRVLATLAEQVVGRLPPPDVIGRWGRAELAVLLPRAAVAEVAVVADALVRMVAEAGAAAPAPPTRRRSRPLPGPLVASIGVAILAADPPGARSGPAPSTVALRVVARAVGGMAAARARGGGWATGGR